jgi:peptidoglycan/LPS O-acetylase OafA/YrhL
MSDSYERARSRISPDPTFPAVPKRPGLAGLGALAVMAVIAYHLEPVWLRGGFFGIDVFFVVASYLGTSLLVNEFRRSGQIGLKRFWLAPASRLLPSMVVFLGAIIVLTCLFARDELPGLRLGVVLSLLGGVNWWLIAHQAIDYASSGSPPLVLHLWPFAVGAQFFLVWPPLLLFLLRRVSLRMILAVTLIGGTGSAGLMAALYHPGLNPSGAYYGTGAHVEGLLIGAAVSILVPPWAPRAAVPLVTRRRLDVFGVAALAGLVSLMVAVGQHSSFAYPWGFLLVDGCAAALIVVVVHPAPWLAPTASWRPIRWVVTRSYALYLWHWPVIQLTRPDRLHFAGWPLLILRLVLIAFAAELSHRLVEVPFQRPEFWAGWRRWVPTGRSAQLRAGLSSAVVAGVFALLVVVPGSVTPAASSAAGGPSVLPGRTHRAVASGRAADLKSMSSGRRPSRNRARVPTRRKTPSTVAPMRPTRPTTTTTSTLPPSAAALAPKEPILALGDSVMLAAKPALAATFGSAIHVDAASGRQVAQGIERLEEYRASGELAQFRTVVIALGTDGPLTPALFDELLTQLQGVPDLIFFDTYDKKPWGATTNAALAAGMSANPGMIELNWAAVASAPGMVNADGTRPTAAGATAFASMLNSILS